MDSLSPLTSNILNLVKTEPISSRTKDEDSLFGGFADVLTEAFKTMETTHRQDNISALELLTGQADDFSSLLLDAQKAEISLNLALQIRNKCIDAYNEIIRMQV